MARRILIVDDNADAADSMAMLLQLDGHETRTAYSAATALELTESFAPEVVLLDIGLPDMDGYEVARRMKAMPRELRVIALSGYGRDRRQPASASFDAHLMKPVDMPALARAIAGHSS
jgi:CheY-like chemotaxis protein